MCVEEQRRKAKGALELCREESDIPVLLTVPRLPQYGEEDCTAIDDEGKPPIAYQRMHVCRPPPPLSYCSPAPCCLTNNVAGTAALPNPNNMLSTTDRVCAVCVDDFCQTEEEEETVDAARVRNTTATAARSSPDRTAVDVAVQSCADMQSVVLVSTAVETTDWATLQKSILCTARGADSHVDVAVNTEAEHSADDASQCIVEPAATTADVCSSPLFQPATDTRLHQNERLVAECETLRREVLMEMEAEVYRFASEALFVTLAAAGRREDTASQRIASMLSEFRDMSTVRDALLQDESSMR
jgi:hypothetical protein